MSITVGDVLRVVAIMAFTDGNIAQMVFNAAIGGTGGPFDDGDILDDAEAWLNDMVSSLTTSITSTLDGSEVIVYKYDDVDEDWDEVAAEPWTWNPSSASDALPRGVALLVTARTTDPDVSGKKYIPGHVEINNDDGSWGAGILTNAASFGDSWVDPFAGGTSGASWVPGIWSPTRENFYAATGDHAAGAEPAYQRRRKRGVGQ